jgi:hypothetical protein
VAIKWTYGSGRRIKLYNFFTRLEGDKGSSKLRFISEAKVLTSSTEKTEDDIMVIKVLQKINRV